MPKEESKEVPNTSVKPNPKQVREGGFKIGEMERDVFITHGFSSLLNKRFYG